MQKESSKNNIMSIRMHEDDRANIEKIRRYWFETSGVLYSASEIIRMLLGSVAARIDAENGGEDNG